MGVKAIMADKEVEAKVEAEAVEKKEAEVDTSKLSADAKKVLEIVEKMTILELAELVKVMENKFGVSAAAPVAVAAAAAPAAAEEVEEKSAYDVVLTNTGDQKIAVIKAIREINNTLGLVEAKQLTESTPKAVIEQAKKEDAEAAKAKLEEAGAKVELK